MKTELVCIYCGSKNVARERRPNGDDHCTDCGKKWPSAQTLNYENYGKPATPVQLIQVQERTDCSLEQAKRALRLRDNDVECAVEFIENEEYGHHPLWEARCHRLSRRYAPRFWAIGSREGGDESWFATRTPAAILSGANIKREMMDVQEHKDLEREARAREMELAYKEAMLKGIPRVNVTWMLDRAKFIRQSKS